MLPRPGQPRLREVRVGRRSCSAATSRIRSPAGSTACPGSTAGGRSRPTWPASSSSSRGAARRFPFLADAEIVTLVCHPDAMTPDAQPAARPRSPACAGSWMAAGLSLNGFGGAGGIGKVDRRVGDRRGDRARRQRLPAVAVRAGARGPGLGGRAAREAYRYYYRLRYPYDTDEWGRPHRSAPLHGRLQDWAPSSERRMGGNGRSYVEPGRPWRRAGPDQRAFGWTRPPWFERVRRGARRRSRAGRAHRHELVREDRRSGARTRWRLLERAAATWSTSAGEGRVHAVPRTRAAASSPT